MDFQNMIFPDYYNYQDVNLAYNRINTTLGSNSAMRSVLNSTATAVNTVDIVSNGQVAIGEKDAEIQQYAAQADAGVPGAALRGQLAASQRGEIYGMHSEIIKGMHDAEMAAIRNMH